MSLQLEHLDLNKPGFLLNRNPKTDEKPKIFEDIAEVGLDAIWSLSSAKSGNGTIEIRDNNSDTFWQSDGPQPHLVDIQFAKKQKLSEINIYLSQKLDESYAPKTISIKIGNSLEELVEIQVVDIRHSEGWVVIPLALPSPVLEKIQQAAERDEFDLEEIGESRTHPIQHQIPQLLPQQPQQPHPQGLSQTQISSQSQTDIQLRETLETIKSLSATQHFHRILPKLSFKDIL